MKNDVCHTPSKQAEKEKRAEIRVLDERVSLVKNLMETMKWTAEQAMEAMKISEADRELLLPRL